MLSSSSSFQGINLIVVLSGNYWQPGIGDPTIIGWITVLFYFITAFFCFKCGQKNKGDRSIWFFCALMLLFLGTNKQLDLQSLLTVIGKKMAIEQGWYDQRRLVQKEFIIGLIAFSCAGVMFLIQAIGTKIKRFSLPLLGIIFLLLFIMIRATSFHHVDYLLDLKLGKFRVNWLLELGGIIFLLTAAMREIFKQKIR